MHRIETETVIHSDSDFATVAFLRVKNAKLVTKEVDNHEAHIPSLLEDHFEEVKNAVQESQAQPSPLGAIPFFQKNVELRSLKSVPSTSLRKGSWVVIGEVQASVSQDMGSLSLEDEVKQCFHIISSATSSS